MNTLRELRKFTESDVTQIASDRPFDAAVGRFILEFLPDPLAALRSVYRLVRGAVKPFGPTTASHISGLSTPPKPMRVEHQKL